MTKWNFSELSKLCEEKGIPGAKIYQNSLGWRWKRADYHAEAASKIWLGLDDVFTSIENLSSGI
jgi:hypothetical protein